MTEQNTLFNFRKGKAGDIEQLKNLGLLSYGQFQNILSPESWEKMASTCGNENTYAELLKIARCFVCEAKNKIIGMAFLIPSGNPSAFFEAEWSYIRLLGVDPLYEGKGIGRQLTEQCIDFAKKSGEKIVALHTSEFQSAARHIYEKLGFKKLKELNHMHDKKYWLYLHNLNTDGNEITYHKANQNDIQILVDMRIEFVVELTGINAPKAIDELKQDLAAYFRKALKNKTCIFYLAKNDKTVVGIGGLVIRDSPGNFKNPSGKWGYLMNMYTVPSFRRKGICVKLLNLLVDDAKSSGIKAFELHATKEGELVYVQHGFEMHHEPTYRKYSN